MSLNQEISKVFQDYQRAHNADHAVRESIRAYSKLNDLLSREITFMLQVIHQSEEEVIPACQKARKLIEEARARYSKIAEIVPAECYYKYYDQWRATTQRFSFLIQLVTWLEQGVLADYETIAETLGLQTVEGKTSFHLNIEDYLVGLLQLSSEMPRFAMNSVTRKEFGRPRKILKLLMEINSGFRVLNLKNDHLRRRYDKLKYDVKKVEEIVYDLNIRGFAPKENEDSKKEQPQVKKSEIEESKTEKEEDVPMS